MIPYDLCGAQRADDGVSDYVDGLRVRLRSMPTGQPQSPWEPVTTKLVGGVHSAGFGTGWGQEDLLLVASWAGRSVIDGLSGDEIARDRDDEVSRWMSPLGVDCAGIGPLDGELVPVAGIWGGGLPRTTEDGWSIALVAPDWPDEMVVLQPPGCTLDSEERARGCVRLPDPISEVRAAGFSRTGRTLVIATSSELTLYSRTVPTKQ